MKPWISSTKDEWFDPKEFGMDYEERFSKEDPGVK
jgi:hypothetical protein